MRASTALDSRKFAVGILEDMKVENIVDITIEGHAFFDRFIVATCTSSRHLQSTGERLVEEGRKADCISLHAEWSPTWVVVDFGPLMVHLFLADVRRRFDLESLWSGEKIDFKDLEEKLEWPTKF